MHLLDITWPILNVDWVMKRLDDKTSHTVFTHVIMYPCYNVDMYMSSSTYKLSNNEENGKYNHTISLSTLLLYTIKFYL